MLIENFFLEFPYNILYPKERKKFTWEDYEFKEDAKKSQTLEVEIEGMKKEYNPDQIKECEPIILNTKKDRATDRNKNIFKKGFLKHKVSPNLEIG